jgi:aminoglycoside 6'-N-acetyltransferase I
MIKHLHSNDQEMIHQTAQLLVDGFKEHWPNAWPDYESALDEVLESFEAGRISRVAVDECGKVVGWIGAIKEYEGHAWQLHPLVVHPDHRRLGIGRSLVLDLEEQIRQRGGYTIYLGTDDEDGMTSLASIDLYPDVFQHIAEIQDIKGHPFRFYQKLGYVIVGVIPDANGPGKPDILMAKRLVKLED